MNPEGLPSSCGPAASPAAGPATRAAATAAEPELVLCPDRRGLLGLLALAVGFTVAGGWMAGAGEWRGWLVGGFFGLCALTFATLLLPGAAYLRIGPGGFEVCSLFGRRPHSWSDVGGFSVARAGRGR